MLKKNKMSERKSKSRLLLRNKIDHIISIESDENLAFIAGYTSGGAPFGLTHEEFTNINNSLPPTIDNYDAINDSD